MHYICSTLFVVITTSGYKILEIKSETVGIFSPIKFIKTKSHECQRVFSLIKYHDFVATYGSLLHLSETTWVQFTNTAISARYTAKGVLAGHLK